MRNIEINFDTREIIITRKFQRAAKRFGSYEYRDLLEAMNNHPTFAVKVRETNNYYRGLTYEFMENYIAANDYNGKIMDDFNELRYANTGGPASYNHIKGWFLNTYPELTEMNGFTNKPIWQQCDIRVTDKTNKKPIM